MHKRRYFLPKLFSSIIYGITLFSHRVFEEIPKFLICLSVGCQKIIQDTSTSKKFKESGRHLFANCCLTNSNKAKKNPLKPLNWHFITWRVGSDAIVEKISTVIQSMRTVDDLVNGKIFLSYLFYFQHWRSNI